MMEILDKEYLFRRITKKNIFINNNLYDIYLCNNEYLFVGWELNQ